MLQQVYNVLEASIKKLQMILPNFMFRTWIKMTIIKTLFNV